MGADRSWSSAVTLCTSNDGNRPAIRLMPPSTDAAPPSGDGIWSDMHASTRSPKNEPPAPATPHTVYRACFRSIPVNHLPSKSSGASQHSDSAATLTFAASASTSTLVHQPHATAIFELASSDTRLQSSPQRAAPQLGELLLRRPEAALFLVPRPAVLFLAGAVAGAIGKTITAPLDRVKILLQVLALLLLTLLSSSCGISHSAVLPSRVDHYRCL